MADDQLRRAVRALQDRHEIEDALSRYSRGLDEREWDQWDGLFTEDARLDYSSIGLGSLTPDQFRAHVSANDGVRVAGQHLHTNVTVMIDGDSAIARAEFTMVNIVRSEDPAVGTLARAGGRCAYELARVDGRWRIRTRTTGTKWSTREVIALG
jgi:hypothetical protein